MADPISSLRGAVVLVALATALFSIRNDVFAQNASGPNVAPPSPERLEQARRYIEMASSSAKVHAYISNFTRMTYDRSHGTQVEYNAPDGKSYLWYPGSRIITLGRWKVDEALAPDQSHRNVSLCYLYSAQSYDPTNNIRGGNWECAPAVLAIIRTKERLPGNPFRLDLSPQAPFVMSPQATNLGTLLAQSRS
ncbi:MAG: hypothetical protein JO216_17800 [Hyphomicrobiales bacterium]|nr:hypothetical protein [Hyphomicrobiales bacterium]